MINFKKHIQLNEAGAGLSQLLKWMQETDCVILTAFRKDNTLKENRERNKHLLMDIKVRGYGPIKVKGTYNEEVLDDNGIGTGEFTKVTEEGWFVPELYGNEDELAYMLGLGKKYDQDSILYVEHPDIPGEEEPVIRASIIGTTDGRTISEEIIPIGSLKLSNVEDLYTEIKGKRFTFSDDDSEEEDVNESFLRMMRPEGLANAYKKREFLKKHKKFS